MENVSVLDLKLWRTLNTLKYIHHRFPKIYCTRESLLQMLTGLSYLHDLGVKNGGIKYIDLARNKHF